jgi:hypothetical protein
MLCCMGVCRDGEDPMQISTDDATKNSPRKNNIDSTSGIVANQLVLKGISEQSTIGYLTQLEALRYCSVRNDTHINDDIYAISVTRNQSIRIVIRVRIGMTFFDTYIYF